MTLDATRIPNCHLLTFDNKNSRKSAICTFHKVPKLFEMHFLHYPRLACGNVACSIPDISTISFSTFLFEHGISKFKTRKRRRRQKLCIPNNETRQAKVIWSMQNCGPLSVSRARECNFAVKYVCRHRTESYLILLMQSERKRQMRNGELQHVQVRHCLFSFRLCRTRIYISHMQ